MRAQVPAPVHTVTIEDLQNRVMALQVRVTKDEREIAALDTKLKQLQADFAKYDAFLRFPDRYREVLVCFINPDTKVLSSTVQTGPPKY